MVKNDIQHEDSKKLFLSYKLDHFEYIFSKKKKKKRSYKDLLFFLCCGYITWLKYI